MPGVPSGKGCETCRAQKKKCDLKKPACSRCTRLRITCKGAGEQRYKFLNVQVLANEYPKSRALKPPRRHSFLLDPHCHSLTNDAHLLAQDLVSRLARPSSDVRTYIGWAYGFFLRHVPARLGHNKALDAATRTLLGIHTEACTYSQSKSQSRMLIQYSTAMKALRDVLNDPKQATSTGTLAAIVLLGCCQARFDGPLSNFKSAHGVGAAHLLRMRQFSTERDGFEDLLLQKLRANMAVQAAFNPSIDLNSDDWHQLDYSYEGSGLEHKLYRCASEFGQLVPLARATVAERNIVEQADVLARIECLEMELEDLLKELNTDADDMCATRLRLRASGCTLAFIAMLSCVRRALTGYVEDHDRRLSNMCKMAVEIARDGAHLRPLGSNWVPCMLMSVWCAAKGSRHQLEVEHALDEFRRGSLMAIDATVEREQLEVMWRRLTLLG